MTNSCGSSASSTIATTPDPSTRADVAGGALERVDRVVRAGEGDQADAVADLARARRPAPAGSRQARAPARLEPSLRLAQLLLERGDAVLDGVGRGRPDERRGALEAVEPLGHEGVGALAGHRLDAAHAGADAPLAGDEEAADLAGRPAVGAAAQLEAVVLDPDGADRLAVLLVEERVGAGVDRLLHAEPGDADRAVLEHDRGGPRPRSTPLLVVGQRAGRTGSRSAGSRGGRASRPGAPTRRPTLRSARWSRCVPVWLRIVLRAPVGVDLGA